MMEVTIAVVKMTGGYLMSHKLQNFRLRIHPLQVCSQYEDINCYLTRNEIDHLGIKGIT